MCNNCVGITGSIVIVLTPLISLMMDQKNKFIKRGIRAEFVGKAQEDTEAMSAVVNGDIQLLYISPESLLHNFKFRNMLLLDKYKRNLRALVVDEAHCVKLWYVWLICVTACISYYILAGEKISAEHL